MGLLSFVRSRTCLLIGLLNAALILSGIQIVIARSAPNASVRPAGASMAVSSGPQLTPGFTRKQAVAPKPVPSRTLHPPVVSPEVVPPALPISGKGMWIWLFNQVEDGDPVRIVRRAKSLGLTHLYVRSSSTTSGLRFLPDIDRIVPAAHAAGIKIIAWDFPRLLNPYADATRIIRVIDHRTPGGDKVDGIAVDLETGGEGVSLSALRARRLALTLKKWRPDTFRVLVPPRPSMAMRSFYPYGIIPAFDAVAPMVYWHQRDAGNLAAEAVRYLKRYGRPVAPIGQAYNAALDPGGKGGAPTARTLLWFAQNALREGAVGLSFWSWQHASPDMFRGIARIHIPDVPAKGHGHSR